MPQRSSSRRPNRPRTTHLIPITHYLPYLLAFCGMYILKDICDAMPQHTTFQEVLNTTIKSHWYLLLLLLLLLLLFSITVYLKEPSSMNHVPKRLILVRHGQSQGNVDHAIYETTPDNQIHLTPLGWDQAISIGKVLKDIVGHTPNDKIRFFVSPYVRTRETHNGIAQAFGGIDQMQNSTSQSTPNNTNQGHIKWCEDPRIREQDFGNFQNASRMKQEKYSRGLFSKFFYRFENGGESSADVYDRVSLFLESLYRYWKRKQDQLDDHNTIVVAHGLTIQVFFMRWFKYSVDEFLQYDNPGNCEAAVLEREFDAAQQKYRLVLKYVVGPDGVRREKRRLTSNGAAGNPRNIHASKAEAEVAAGLGGEGTIE